MKQITAIIQPHRLARVREAARHLSGFPGMTIDKVEGFSEHQDSDEDDRSPRIKRELADYSPKVRLVILSPEDKVDAIVTMIAGNCRSGEKGDGVIWVSPVEHALSIRNA